MEAEEHRVGQWPASAALASTERQVLQKMHHVAELHVCHMKPYETIVYIQNFFSLEATNWS